MTRYKPGEFEMYGFLGILRLAVFLIRTKLIISNARLIRFPFYLRGRKYIQFGNNLTTGTGCRIEAFPYINQNTIIEIGENVEMNDNVHISGLQQIKIGNNVLLASRIFISDINHGSYMGNEKDSDPESHVGSRPVFGNPVEIEDNVWIGEGAAVLAGVRIGRCSIIGANSVVTKNIPPFTIAAGNPARPIKQYDFKSCRWVLCKK